MSPDRKRTKLLRARTNAPNLVLTYEHSRRSAGAASIVEPIAAPAPRTTAAEVETQRATVAVRTAQDDTVEENVPGVTVHPLLEACRDKRLVLPERLEGVLVQTTDATVGLKPVHPLLASDNGFALPKKGNELDFGQVDL